MLQNNIPFKGLFFSILLHATSLGLVLYWQANFKSTQSGTSLETALITAKFYTFPSKTVTVYEPSPLPPLPQGEGNSLSQIPGSTPQKGPLPRKGGGTGRGMAEPPPCPPFCKGGEHHIAQLEGKPPMSTGNEQLNLLLNRKLEENKMYPSLAQKLGQTGVAKISFWLDITGEISAPSIEASTGVATLDAAALRAVWAINPVIEAKTLLLQKKQFVVDIRFIVE